MARGPRATGGTSQLRLTPISPDHPSTTVKRTSKTPKEGEKRYGPKPVKIVASQEDK